MGFLERCQLYGKELKEILKEELLQIRSNLTVDIKTLTSSLRKRISANDVRTLSSTIGYFGIVFIIILILLIILIDLTRFFMK